MNRKERFSEWQRRMDTVRFMEQDEIDKRTTRGKIVVRNDKLADVSRNVCFKYDNERSAFPFGSVFYQFVLCTVVGMINSPDAPRKENFIMNMIMMLSESWDLICRQYGPITRRGPTVNPLALKEGLMKMTNSRKLFRQKILFASTYLQSLVSIPLNLTKNFQLTFRLNMLYKLNQAIIAQIVSACYPVCDALEKGEVLAFRPDGEIEIVVGKTVDDIIEGHRRNRGDNRRKRKRENNVVQIIRCSSPAFTGMILSFGKEGEANLTARTLFLQEFMCQQEIDIPGTAVLSRI
jgi:hypothetical protein